MLKGIGCRQAYESLSCRVASSGGPHGYRQRLNASLTIMRPPQHGSGGRIWIGSSSASPGGDATALGSSRARAILAFRELPATRPQFRMRWKPRGKTWSRKRRMKSSTGSVMTCCRSPVRPMGGGDLDGHRLEHAHEGIPGCVLGQAFSGAKRSSGIISIRRRAFAGLAIIRCLPVRAILLSLRGRDIGRTAWRYDRHPGHPSAAFRI